MVYLIVKVKSKPLLFWCLFLLIFFSHNWLFHSRRVLNGAHQTNKQINKRSPMFDRRLEHWFQLELGLKSRISNLESWSESESESELDGLQTARACSYSYSGCCSCSCCRVHQSRVAVLPLLLVSSCLARFILFPTSEASKTSTQIRQLANCL